MLRRNHESTRRGRSQRYSPNLAILLIVTSGVVMSGMRFAGAQSFSSGSNGSDGALNLTTPGTILFDPKSFNPPLDPDGDGIFNFTTINIAAGVTVKLSGKIFSRPVFWLATGAVTIDGVIDLNGEAGHVRFVTAAQRIPSAPGAGGYSGGVGGRDTSTPAQPGNGPGGGVIGENGFPVGGTLSGGSFTGNPFLVPLVGGSGGGGELLGNDGRFGAGGGAGGGAILIASSNSIAVNGLITANGGGADTSAWAGAGSGGAIRLVAPTISGNGSLLASGGNAINNSFRGSRGRVRIEAFSFSSLGGGIGADFTQASPFNVFLPSLPSVRVVSVAGVPVNQSPMGSFQMPDVTINSASAVTVVIEARNIPVGTVVKLHLFSENGADQFVNATPLAGTSQISTASASVVLPSGFSRGFVRATWTQ